MIGTSADMMINIWGAMILGGLAGAVSIFIDRLSTVGSNYFNIAKFTVYFIKYLLFFMYTHFKTKEIHRIIGIRNAW